MMMIMISYIIDLIKLPLHMIIMDKLTSLRAERRRREVTREKFTHEKCTFRKIHLGPAGRRPALGLVLIKGYYW